ncbi:hypothetical protein [Klebsiella variicola]|uniref:hypothetical protein n=1 Tax=Klebsiella variicola TaxID=244366 RepID=UPI001BD45A60|nr:hypothetical protein [Klebsiella variicola]
MEKATALETELLNDIQKALLKVTKKENVADRVNDLTDIGLVLTYAIEQIQKIILAEIAS